MKSNARSKQITRLILSISCAAVLALALAVVVMLPQPALADNIDPPTVPTNLQVGPENKVFLLGHATGTQDYICLSSGSGVAWTFLRPQATLFKDSGDQITTHYLSPNPFENGEPRATWQHSLDTSAVWARAVESSSDPAFVAPGAIPWLKLISLGSQDGPTGGDRLTKTVFIQRVNTTGGVAPSTGCQSLADVGNKAYVPYTADYYFYR